MYYLWISGTVSEYLKEQGLSRNVDELPPNYRARASRTALELTWRGRLGANLVSKGCGILSIAQVARSYPATAPLLAVGIHWATEANGGGEARCLAVILRPGGDHHPVP